MSTMRNTPTPDEVADHPTSARELPSTAVGALLAKRAALQSALATALAAGSADGHDTAAAPSTDSLLTVGQAAEHVRKPAIGIGNELHHLVGER
jgi:hypothetical protein